MKNYTTKQWVILFAIGCVVIFGIRNALTPARAVGPLAPSDVREIDIPPGQYTFRGAGTNFTRAFFLEKGAATFHFIVERMSKNGVIARLELTHADGGRVFRGVVEDEYIGRNDPRIFESRKMVRIPQSGEYVLHVESSGAGHGRWAVSVN